MKSVHRYILEPYKGMNSRYSCPSCQQRDKTFSLYIDTETGEHVNPTVGRCNRENNCGYHYTPKQYFQDNNISFDVLQPKKLKPRPITPQRKPVSFIPVEIFKASLKAHETNYFVQFLINLFGVEVASQLVSRYFIGTSKHWVGATVFWQIDTQGKVRTGKIMLYSPTSGKRVKEPVNHISWVHKALKQTEFELKQCLFGEHLLHDATKPIGIVESEKTAIIASVYLPQFIWLATGSLASLNAEKCSILKGRIVILFPDLNAFEKWSNKVKELTTIAMFTVSNLLERKATEAERKQGFDLADYLIKYNYQEFTIPESQASKSRPDVKALEEVKPFEEPGSSILIPTNKPIRENWDQDIDEFKIYFAKINLPTQPIKLNNFSTITNCSLFIESNIATVQAANGNPTFLPYLIRLKQLKQVLITNFELNKSEEIKGTQI